MPSIKIVLAHPHIELEDSAIEYCVSYRLTEAVGGVIDGEVGFAPDPGMTNTEIMDTLKQMAADHANLQTENALGWTVDDVITWEVS